MFATKLRVKYIHKVTTSYALNQRQFIVAIIRIAMYSIVIANRLRLRLPHACLHGVTKQIKLKFLSGL